MAHLRGRLRLRRAPAGRRGGGERRSPRSTPIDNYTGGFSYIIILKNLIAATSVLLIRCSHVFLEHLRDFQCTSYDYLINPLISPNILRKLLENM